MRTTTFVRFFQHLNFATLRRTIVGIGRQRLTGLAAEMAYNAMLGLFPAILAVLTAIGLFQPLNATFRRLAGRFSDVAPVEVLTIIQNFVEEISSSRDRGLFSLSFVIAIWASSGALSAAMTALDQIHRIPHRKRRPFWKARLIAIGLTIGTILLLVLASALVFVGEWSLNRIAEQSGWIASILLSFLRLLSWPLALGIVSSAFAFVYRFGPSRWMPEKPIFPGAIVAAVLWAFLSNLFRLYVANFGDYNRAYGAVGAVIVLLLWLYLSSLVLLLGDQLNVSVAEEIQQQTAGRSPSVRQPTRIK